MGQMFFLPSTINANALKGTQSTNPNQWPDLILSSSTSGLLMEGALICPHKFRWHCNNVDHLRKYMTCHITVSFLEVFLCFLFALVLTKQTHQWTDFDDQ